MSVDHEEDSDDSEESVSNLKTRKKRRLGDMLFGDQAKSDGIKSIVETIKDPKTLRKIITKENPELSGLVEELRVTLNKLNKKPAQYESEPMRNYQEMK